MIKELMVQVGTALIAWITLAIFSYIAAAWCFSYPVVWSYTLHWVTLIVGGLGVSLGVLYLVSADWAYTFTTLLLPAFICVLSLQGLLVALRRYLMQRIPGKLNAGRFYTTLAILYVFFLGGTWCLIMFKNQFLMTCVSLFLNYFIYAAVLGTSLVACFTRRVIPK